MEITNRINKRYRFQMISLIIAFLTYIPLGAFIISTFFLKEYLGICSVFFVIFLLLDVVIVILFFHMDIVALPPINNMDVLREYLEYYTHNNLSDFKYATVIGSFSRVIKDTRNRRTVGEYSKFDELIDSLYLVLRVEEKSYEECCVAAYHKKEFVKLANNMLDGTYQYEQALQMRNEPKDVDSSIKGNVLKLLRKNISIEAILFMLICHFIACFMKGEGIIAQLLLAIPPDILMILVYAGVVKEHKNDK